MKFRIDPFNFSLFVFVMTVLGAASLLAVQSFPVTGGAQTAQAADSSIVPCGRIDLNKDGMIKDVGQFVEECHFSDFIKLVSNITNFLIILGTSVAALAFAYAGFLMLTASGEMGKIEEAKAIFGKVVVGFLFMLSAWLIVHAIEAAFIAPSSGIESLLK
jgi:hypothetical protein